MRNPFLLCRLFKPLKELLKHQLQAQLADCFMANDSEEEEVYKLLPANKANHLCQLWQSCSDLHEIQTVYGIVENPHSIRLSKKRPHGVGAA